MSPGSSTFDYQESDDEFSLVSPACRSPGLNIACISRPYSRSCSVISVTFFQLQFQLFCPCLKLVKLNIAQFSKQDGHWSSATLAVRWLPSAACAATPPFDVRSSGLFCGRPGGRGVARNLIWEGINFNYSHCNFKNMSDC